MVGVQLIRTQISFQILTRGLYLVGFAVVVGAVSAASRWKTFERASGLLDKIKHISVQDIKDLL